MLESRLEFLTKGMAISCLSAMKLFIWSKCVKDFILVASPPVLVDESLAFLKELSKLFHLSLHCVPVLIDEQEFTSRLNLFISRAISLHFWQLPFPFSAALDPLQRSIKIFSSASGHGVLFLFWAVDEELSLDFEDAGELGCEGEN